MPSLARDPPGQPADPRVTIIAQAGHHFVSGCVVPAGLVLDAFLLRAMSVAGWEPDGATRSIGSEDESLRIDQLRLHTGLGPDAA